MKKVVRPKSPQERSTRTISKDLLFLQVISKAHDSNAGRELFVSQTHTHTLYIVHLHIHVSFFPFFLIAQVHIHVYSN